MKGVDKSKIFDKLLFRQADALSMIGPNALPPDQLDRVSLQNLVFILRVLLVLIILSIFQNISLKY